MGRYLSLAKEIAMENAIPEWPSDWVPPHAEQCAACYEYHWDIHETYLVLYTMQCVSQRLDS